MVNRESFKSEFDVIQPDEELLRGTTEYLHKVQSRKSANNSAFLPTGLGILLTPEGKNIMFAMYGAGEGNVYDMESLDGTHVSAETSDVLFCGVTKAEFERYKLLTHAGGPEAVRRLTARGLQLAVEEGASLDGKLSINVYCNPQKGHETYVSGSNGYKAQIEQMGRDLELDVLVSQNSVTQMSKIRV